MKKLSWFTPPVGEQQGYGYAAINLVEALQRKGVYVGWLDGDAKAHISWVQPEWYEGYTFQYRVGYTPWESTVIPKTWVPRMNEQDEIWTPATFCKDVFEAHGVKEVTVIPHGINPEHYPIVEGEPDAPFTFIHVGGPTERKGGARVVNAFLDLFDGNRDIQLVMKSTGFSEGRWEPRGGGQRNASEHPQITVYEFPADINFMREFYGRGHCMVYPSNGEGFGLIPFQAIASGIPTICTNGTAMSDFANMSIPLDFTWGPGEGIHYGDWCIPDEQDLRDKMLWVVDNWREAKDKTMKNAKWIHQNQTWDNVADKILDILGNKID